MQSTIISSLPAKRRKRSAAVYPSPIMAALIMVTNLLLGAVAD
jgi:hypothetical protein